MLLTGYAGQVSLGHAGLLAAGAFTAGILFKESAAPFCMTLPAAAIVGALLGVVFGLPSLRLRGLYLVSHAGPAFPGRLPRRRIRVQTRLFDGHRIDPPKIAGYACTDPRLVLHSFGCSRGDAALSQLIRSRSGRAWGAIRRMRRSPRRLGSACPLTSSSPLWSRP